jgi:hypothetical protein
MVGRLQTGEQRRGGEEPAARRGKLDGERQTVEQPTKLDDGANVLVVERKAGPDCACPVVEEPDGRRLGGGRQLRFRRREGKGWNQIALLPRRCRGSRLVTSIESRGAAANKPESDGAAGSRCSKLSSKSSICLRTRKYWTVCSKGSPGCSPTPRL